MRKKQAVLSIGCILLLIVTVYAPCITAGPIKQSSFQKQIQPEIDRVLGSLMDRIEQEASSEEDIVRILEEYADASFPPNTTIVQDVIEKLLHLFTTYLSTKPGKILSKKQGTQTALANRLSDPLVLSYGAYKRYNLLKENEIQVVKRGLSVWHYGPRAKVLTGRTLVVKFRPFEVVRTNGIQFGIMKGFRGFYCDIESKMTDMSYTFFIGRAQRVRAFDFNFDFSLQR